MFMLPRELSSIPAVELLPYRLGNTSAEFVRPQPQANKELIKEYCTLTQMNMYRVKDRFQMMHTHLLKAIAASDRRTIESLCEPRLARQFGYFFEECKNEELEVELLNHCRPVEPLITIVDFNFVLNADIARNRNFHLSRCWDGKLLPSAEPMPHIKFYRADHCKALRTLNLELVLRVETNLKLGLQTGKLRSQREVKGSEVHFLRVEGRASVPKVLD